MTFDFSDDFWLETEQLTYLSNEDILFFIEQNKKQSVPFPENMLLKQLTSENKQREATKQEFMTALEKKHLLKERIDQGDFFISETPELPFFRNDMASMENPIFALKAGDVRVINYVSTSKGKHIHTQVRPSVEIGRATIFDKDIWIFAISKLMQAKFNGQDINNAVEVSVTEFLKLTNRGNGGNQYLMFKESLDRLQGTTITTEITTGGQKTASGFGLLDGWEIVQKNKKNLPLKVVIQLPGWLYRSIESDEVLSISNQYFRLKKPIDRRIYEIARKHCGNQQLWKISLERLHQKTGASMTIRKFRLAIQSLVKVNVLPGYIIQYERTSDMVTFLQKQEPDS